MANLPESLLVAHQVFQAFSDGQLESLAAAYAPEAELVVAGAPDLPFGGRYTGPQGVLQFFSRLAPHLELLGFEPQRFVAGGDQAVVLGRTRWRARATGREAETSWAVAFVVEEGLVRRCEVYQDTLALAAILR